MKRKFNGRTLLRLCTLAVAAAMLMSVSAFAFTYTPYWGEDHVQVGVGGELMFFGDIHDYEDDYFYYDPATGETRGVFTYLKEGDRHPGMYVSIGDYLQAKVEITQEPGVYSKCIGRLRAWAGEDVPIISVMGNHENGTQAVGELNGEQVFEQYVGNNNYGLVAKGVDEADPNKVLYYVVAFGCSHNQEDDAAGSRATAKNKYWVNPDQIKALDETLAGIYGADGSKNQGVPTFVDAHLPIHYYTDERWAENNGDVLAVLNKYPYVVYVWGHDHSEKDPYYGTVKLPGDTLVPYATLDALNSAGETAAQEINFTYVACGVVRGNQISDNESEDSERALFVSVDGSKVSFEYCGRDGKVFDRTRYTNLVDTTYFENFLTLGAKSAAGATVDLMQETDMSVVRRGDFFLTRPVAGQTPGGVVSFSHRYDTAIEWLDASGAPVSGAFGNGEAYTAKLTLTAKDAAFALTGEDVFLFDTSAVAIPAAYIAEKTAQVAQDGSQAVIEVKFQPTPALLEKPLEAAGQIVPGEPYVLAAGNEIYLSTQGRLDCICRDGKLLSAPNADLYWSFAPSGAGYVMKNAAGDFLTVGINGPHVVLTPVKDLSEGTYTVWYFQDGALCMSVNGAAYSFTNTNGVFALTTAGGEIVQLFGLSDGAAAPGLWYSEAVNGLAQAGTLKFSGVFDPAVPMTAQSAKALFGYDVPAAGELTRLQAAELIAQVCQIPGAEGKPFTDTDSALVAGLAAAGVLNGYPDGTFRPDQAVTAAEVAVMLFRAQNA